MAAVEESPLLKALPPETDYLTYLTIVEYNLSRDQLPILHDLLQDSTLTINIGWDLVKLLLPLLPESEQCLRDIALLGNPRETILKVAELLEELGQENEEEDQLDGESSDHDAVRPARNSHINENESRTSLLTLQFQSLLHMLCILHPRIKTRYPSRFLVTSIQAVIRAYKALAQVPGSMGPILMLLKSMSESKQPHLPPRKSQQAVPTVTVGAAAPDPEQEADTVTEEEAGLKQRILRCFVTHVMESYICALLPVTETSPLAWSNRFFERRYPEKLLPHRSTYRSLFQEQADLEMRDATISQLLNTANSDLAMPWPDLLQSTLDSSTLPDPLGSVVSVQDLPLSKAGALYLLAARAFTALTNDRPVPFRLTLFPQHDTLTHSFLSSSSNPIALTPSLIDGVLLLGYHAFDDTHGILEPGTRTEFNSYLHRLTSVAANMPLSDLRFQAHAFASSILHSNPSSDARLDFIQDTLEHCPYENLRVSAVGWLKDETLSAFNLPLNATQTQNASGLRIVGIASSSDGDGENVFGQPLAVRACAPWLFAEPDVSVDAEHGEEDMAGKFPFWLAVLNFYYLLCSNKVLSEGLDVSGLDAEFDVREKFLGGLAKLRDSGETEDGSGLMDRVEFNTEIWALEDGLARLRGLEREKGKEVEEGLS